MRILKHACLFCSLLSTFVVTNPVEGLEIAAWSGTDVQTFDSTYKAPSASANPGVDAAGTGGKIGANITLSAGILNERLITVTLGGGYFQFQVAADSGYDIQVDNFQVTTNLVIIGLGTSIQTSTTEGGSYSTLASLNIDNGTNTFDFASSPVSIPAGETRFFRMTSVAQIITYDVTQASVFRFNGTVTPVPEPSAYALVAAGITVLGFVGRNRRRNADTPCQG